MSLLRSFKAEKKLHYYKHATTLWFSDRAVIKAQY